MHLHRIRSNLGKPAIPALLLFLLPTTSHAQVGPHPGHLLYLILGLCMVWVIFSLLVLMLCLMLGRRLSIWVRIGLPLLFFFAPLLLFGLAVLKAYAFGENVHRYTEKTRKPMEVYGVSFPPGSEADYEATGGFFGWRAERTLISIRSPHPLPFGNVFMSAFIYIPNDALYNQARMILSENQTINGLPCGETVVDLTPSGPVFKQCFLAKPHKVGERLLPSKSFVHISACAAEPETE